MKYYIIAGEASGDLHGSNLMKGLYGCDPEADIRFWGGALMDGVFHAHQKGTGLVHDYNEGAVMGFSQIYCTPDASSDASATAAGTLTASNPTP